MKKLPARLKIGGHSISVHLVKLDGINGESSFSKNEIRIANDLPLSQQWSTLFHEVFHFLNTTLDDTPLGHALIDSLSEQFFQVLTDNKLLP